MKFCRRVGTVSCLGSYSVGGERWAHKNVSDRATALTDEAGDSLMQGGNVWVWHNSEKVTVGEKETGGRRCLSRRKRGWLDVDRREPAISTFSISKHTKKKTKKLLTFEISQSALHSDDDLKLEMPWADELGPVREEEA